jgi:hypothetical protein
VSTPSINQFPLIPIVITGVCPSLPGSPWIPCSPSLPLVTVNVVVFPSVYVIVYVSTNPSFEVSSIALIPFPTAPVKPFATTPVLTPSMYQKPSWIVITGE